MAFFYVKDDGTGESGTATGDGGRYTTAKTTNDWTDAFAATTEYYASIGAALDATTPPTDGDYIYISDLHNKSYDNIGSPILNAAGATDGAGLIVASVDDTDLVLYKPGASEALSDAIDDFLLDGNGLIAGVSLSTNDNTIQSSTTIRSWVIQDCTLTTSSGTDTFIYSILDGSSFTLKNVDLDNSGTAAINDAFFLANNAKLVWLGGSCAALSQDITNLIAADTIASGSGGYRFHASGVDLTNVNNLADYTSATTTDCAFSRFDHCILDAANTALHGTMYREDHRIEVYNCDQTGTDLLNRFYIASVSGVAKLSSSVFVTANDGFFEETDKGSIQVTTSASCNHVIPFTFELPSKYMEMAVGVSDTLSINIVTDFALTDTEIAFFLMYPDGTTQVQANWISSGKNVGTDPHAAGNYGTDPLAAGSALNTIGALAAGDWTGEPASPTFYKVELDTVGDAGAAGVPTVRVEVYKASIAGTTGSYLYIDPVLAVGT